MSDRLLFLERFLMENTDEDTTVSTRDILDAYQAAGFGGNRNIVPADIEKLREAGVEAAMKKEGNTNCYHIAKRPFLTAELRTLIDAVSSSQFITKEKSDELIRKLATLAVKRKRDSLTAKAFTADRIKTDAPDIFDIIDCVGNAIDRGKKIAFRYIIYNINKEVVLRKEGKEYIVSPMALIWDNRRYYTRCIDPEKPNPVNYRIDRMRNVRIVEETAMKEPGFNPSEYANKVHLMFDDGKDAEDIILLAENNRMINVIDRYGDNIKTEIVDDGHFRATVNAVPSDTFYAWLFEFGGSILVEGPTHIRNAYAEQMRKTLEKQSELNAKL